MPSQTWFRLYNETLNDPKVQSLPDELFKFWINILCVASKCDGKLPSHVTISFHLRASQEFVINNLNKLVEASLLDKKGDFLIPHNWSGRQYKSDSSAERTKNWRKKKKAVTVTSHVTSQERHEDRHRDAPETETETDTEINKEDFFISRTLTPKKEKKDESVFQDYFDILTPRFASLGFGGIKSKTAAMFSAWLEEGVTGEDVMRAIQFCEDEGKKVYSPEYYANIAVGYCRERKRYGNYQDSSKGEKKISKTALEAERIFAERERQLEIENSREKRSNG